MTDIGLRVASIIIIGGLLLFPSAHAEEARKVIHDGVEMALTKAGDNGLEIAYGAEVPPTLRELGVTAGTMLVRGQWEDKLLVGEAWAFSPDCKSVSYPVLGMVDFGGALVVFGPVPRSCKVNGDYSWGKEAMMRFEQPPTLAKTEAKKAKRATAPKSKPKPRARAAPRQPSAPSYWPTYQQPQWRW